VFLAEAKWGSVVILRGINFTRSTSALGHKRTLKRLHPMSALPPIADIAGRQLNVRFVPIPDLSRCSELSTFYSIISSAMLSRDAGIVSPSIRAVSALMTSSNLFDCNTGKSAGFSPLRMRPA
jgi:hypothetical protein